MKFTDKIASLTRPFYTFEFFPPKTDEGFENLLSRISRLAAFNPVAISITWGAGGSTKDRSLELAAITQADYAIDTILHLTCTNIERGTVDDALKTAKERGIQTILALRGDPPRGEEYWIPTDPQFQHAVDLVSYIRSSPTFSSDFCIGVAAYPDGHTDQDADEDGEIQHLKEKVNAGAEFIVTQLFYDVDNFLRWTKKVRQKGIHVPIIPGIMPIQSYASFLRVTKLCGTRIPPALMLALEPIRHDDQKVKDFGVLLAVDMVRRLTTEGCAEGVHFCTLNLEKSVQRVLEGLAWIGGTPKVTNRLIAEATDATTLAPPSDSKLLITPIDATNSAATGLSNLPNTVDEAGSGELNNAATWDEFPNGRFGDYKSPAFGGQDPWNAGLGISPQDALSQWGQPTSDDDLTNVFLRYLQQTSPTTPFSRWPLDAESQTILPELDSLTRRGWWTVGSQPAVDGAPSDDTVVGWGPRGGYVFQKAFVEFFVSEDDVRWIEEKVRTRGSGWVDFFAGNVQGELRSNISQGGKNAVTWGVFPGQEVAQSTIIERDSFLSWKEEAFSIWAEWALLFAPESPQRKLLEGVRANRWLVSIVHHDYKDATALWKFLSEKD